MELVGKRGFDGEVHSGGVTQPVSLVLVPDAEVGDYVLIHAGYAISVVAPEEAQETLRLFEQLAAADEEAP
jgi:hydrogenase expression/formation protein HypC